MLPAAAPAIATNLCVLQPSRSPVSRSLVMGAAAQLLQLLQLVQRA